MHNKKAPAIIYDELVRFLLLLPLSALTFSARRC